MDGQMQKNATDVKHDVKVAQGQTPTPRVNLSKGLDPLGEYE